MSLPATEGPTSPAPSRVRRLVRLLGWAGLLFLGALLGLWLAVRASVPEARLEVAAAALPAEAIAAGIPAALPKQGQDQCGPYALAFGLSAVLGETVQGAALVPVVSHTVPFSRALSGTLPHLLVAEAARRGAAATALTARSADDAGKLALLRQHLAIRQPVLVLVRSERDRQHYVVVCGYAGDDFFLYDPNHEADPADPSRTRDDNGDRPGNRTFPSALLLERWGQGGGGGLYTYWFLPLGRRG